MYENSLYQEFCSRKNFFESEKIEKLLEEIEKFYQELNKKFDYCTHPYQDTVKSILDQFPIKISNGIKGEAVFSVNNKKVLEISELVEALEKYISKFETIRYLDFLSEEHRNVIFVGPNGCGKTTLLRKLKKDTQGASIQYFSADRVLLVSDNFNPKRSYEAFIKDFEESYRYSTNIDYAFQGSKIIEQFDFFINLLERERNEENERKVYNGVTEKIIQKWHELVKDRELFFEHGLCVRPIGGEKYPLKYLSSGEKSILYFLVGILLQEEKEYYFIDEPENNLNPAIVSKLWDFIERERPNSIFVYLTHDSDFVASRINTKIYWIEKYDGNKWEWRQLQENKDLPQDLMIELVGSREPILFCEAKNEYKYDSKFFKLMFPEFKIVSSGGCDKVMNSIKAYKALGLPQKVYGIVDCDYKMDTYLKSLSKHNIYFLPFFEIENLFLCEQILKPMVEKYSQEEDKYLVINNIKQKVRELFISQKLTWIAKHVAFDMRNQFDYYGKISDLKDLEQLKKIYNSQRKEDKEIDEIAKKYEDIFEKIIAEDDYETILRHLDYKGLLSQYRHIFKFGKGNNYEELVFAFLNSLEGEVILKQIRCEFLSEITA